MKLIEKIKVIGNPFKLKLKNQINVKIIRRIFEFYFS